MVEIENSGAVDRQVGDRRVCDVVEDAKVADRRIVAGVVPRLPVLAAAIPGTVGAPGSVRGRAVAGSGRCHKITPSIDPVPAGDRLGMAARCCKSLRKPV